MSSDDFFPALEGIRFDSFWEEGDRVFGRYRPSGAANDDAAWLAVWPAAEKPCPVMLSTLAHEFALRAHLDPAWALQPVALHRERGNAVLLMRDPGGEPLSRLLGTPGMPMDTARFLDIAIGMATAVGSLHQSGLIHKDLKPGHFLVSPSGAGVWLTGFGNAARIARESAGADAGDGVGTLAYMAPEQTGRMNRPVDTRSDLYALGVTFYQMLTGELPFQSAEPRDLVHGHLARKPVPPAGRVPGIPAPLSDIVMKLLAKSPDERYQTAAGLKADLQRSRAAWRDAGTIAPFALGERDLPDTLAMPARLYGREREIATLTDAWARVAETGRSEIVLVSGYSGVGKTSVVQALQRATEGRSGRFAMAKSDRHDETIPYATLAQALGSLLRSLLAMPAATQGVWRAALSEAAATDAALLAPLIPEIDEILGRSPAPWALQPREAERRLQQAFEAVIGVLARTSRPLTLFLDDVQWLDDETLGFVERMMRGGRMGNLLVVCAYRANEVHAGHPLLQRLAALREAGPAIREIALGALDAASLGALLADTLHCTAPSCVPLTRLVMERTGGNPFFAIEFVTGLADEGLLRLDHGLGRWTWNLDLIRAKGFTDNVVDLMLDRIGRLPPATQAVLKLLACLGNDTTLANLRRVWADRADQASRVGEDTDDGAQDLDTPLWEAIRAGLVVREHRSFRFRHDRILEAAYALIPEAQRLPLHLRIGRRLAETVPRAQIDENIFVIVEQLNRAAGLIDVPGERERLATLNLTAALRAKAVAAYITAQHYLEAADALLDADTRASRHALAFALAQHRAECEFRSGDLARAEARLAGLAGQAANLPELAAITQLQLELLLTDGRREEAVGVGLAYLDRAGISWSRQPSAADVACEWARMWRALADHPIERLRDQRPMTDPEVSATMRVLVELMQPAWYTDDNLRTMVVVRMVNLSLSHGNSDDSSMVYGWVSMLLMAEPGREAAAFAFAGVAMDLAEHRRVHRFTARVYQVVGGNVMHWNQPLQAARAVLQKALDVTRETRNFTYAAYIHSCLGAHALGQGEPLREVQAAMERGNADTWGQRHALVKDRIVARRQLVRSLRGLTPVFGRLDAEDFDEAAFEAYLQADVGRQLAACWYWIRKLQARYLAGDHAQAVVAADHARALLWTSPAYFEQAEYHFHAALALAAHADAGADKASLPDVIQTLGAHHRQLLDWARHCPSTFDCRARLVGAEIARLEGREVDAMRGYDAAVAAARDQGFVQVQAMANEVAARFHLERGLDTVARVYLQEARRGYDFWGADAKVWQLDALHPGLLRDARGAPSGAIDGQIKHLDLATVIAVSQAVSGETRLDRLIETLMRTAIEQAGASRGVLILPEADGHRVVAEARVEADHVTMDLTPRAPSADDIPLSLVHDVIQRREHVVLDDAMALRAGYTAPCFRLRQTRSVLCLPLMNQARLVGVLYLENELAPRVFVPARTEVLKLLAFQAATAIENSRLDAERRRADDALRQAQAELAHASRVMTMSALASSIAHEVSQPLVAVVANANAGLRWLNRQTPDLFEVGEALTAIVSQGQRASEVIAGMRAMLRKTAPDRALLDINVLIRETLVLIEGEALRHGCVIRMEPGAALPAVLCDRVQVQQVLLNLVMNGLEAMQETDPEQRTLTLRTAVDAEGVRVAVADAGVGLDAEAGERLFEAFFTTKAGGLGMGLSICQAIVEAHGGRLWASPNRPHGTVFHLALPPAG